MRACVDGQRIWLLFYKYRKKIFQRVFKSKSLCVGIWEQPFKRKMKSEQREVLQAWHRTAKGSRGKNHQGHKRDLGTDKWNSVLEKKSRSGKEKMRVWRSKEKTKDNTAKGDVKTSLNLLVVEQGVQHHGNNSSLLFYMGRKRWQIKTGSRRNIHNLERKMQNNASLLQQKM